MDCYIGFNEIIRFRCQFRATRHRGGNSQTDVKLKVYEPERDAHMNNSFHLPRDGVLFNQVTFHC